MLGIFKKIRNFPNYMVSDNGEVYSIKRQKFLKPRKDKDGYLRFKLCSNKKCKTITLHRLVAMTFLNNPNNYPVINHKDGNKLNNNIDNLEFCTIAYNNQHAFNSGLCENTREASRKNGKNVGKMYGKIYGKINCKYAHEARIKHLDNNLKELFDDIFINKLKNKDICNKYNLKKSYVSQVKTGRLLKHALQEYFNGSKDS